MRYYMKSKFFKFKEDFWIKNEFNEEVFFVDNKFMTLGLQFDILKNDNVLYFVKEKLMTFMSTYEMYENNNVVASVNQKFTFFKDKIEIDSKYGNLSIEGNIFDYNYKIYKDNKVIAVADKELFAFTDNYSVDINFEDHAFVLALIVIIDNIKDKRRS
ncbi:LURP-one-related/scramblase family protein [Romboutsia sp.]|uniref:LURP-one-related/scramblase family protein n=1 Tax=Romboutsia sp. TaxID=1965302 RepID=UPI003F2E1F41